MTPETEKTMSIFTERVYLDQNQGWGWFDAICVTKTPGCNKTRGALVVCPGGAYCECSDREAIPVAMKFLPHGYNAFILEYSTVSSPNGITDKKTGHPKPLLELSKTIAHIRKNAEKYNIDPEKIAVIGFSAGGHLVASAATLWHREFVYKSAGLEYGENKPNAAILCYPVISSDESFAHIGSIKNLLCDSKNYCEDSLIYSAEKQVSEKTSPCFIWHTADDQVVNVRNSLIMAQALAEKSVPAELHIYPNGIHGLSVASDEVYDVLPKGAEHASAWIDSCVRWLGYILD